MKLEKAEAIILATERQFTVKFQSRVIESIRKQVIKFLEENSNKGNVTQEGLNEARRYLLNEIADYRGDDNPVYVVASRFCSKLLTVLGVIENKIA